MQYEDGASERYIAGTLVNKSQTYSDTASIDSTTKDRSVYEEWYDATHSLVTQTFKDGDEIYAVLHSDGRRTTYQTATGTYNSSTAAFTTGSGTDKLKTRIEGTAAAPAGIANKTTKIESISNEDGELLCEKTYVFTGGTSYSLMTTTKHTYTGGKRVESARDGVVIFEATYTDGRITSEKDDAGIETTYTYDTEGRVATRTIEGSPDLVTTCAYDVLGRTKSEVVSGGSLSQTVQTVYDVAGRIYSETDTEGRVIVYTYTNSGRTTTETGPGGVTRITDHYLDGQTKSNTGTGVIASYMHYGSTGAFTQYSEERMKDDAQTRYSIVTVDGLGREGSVVTPKYGSGTRTEGKSYNSDGELETETRTGLGDIEYTYADPFTTTRTIEADPDSDQVVESTKTYAQISSHAHAANGWYEISTTTTGTGADVAVTVFKRQIAGLGRDAIQVDGQGNETVSITSINRSTKTVTTSIYTAGVSQPSVTIEVNGLLTSSQTAEQAEDTTYTYDDLRRILTIVSPETGTLTNVYDSSTGRLTSRTAQGGTTSYSYYGNSHANAGLLDTETSPGGGTKIHAYNNRGQLTSVRGTASYALDYEYTGYGQLWKLKTYRSASGTSDVTTWAYEDSTGLLTAKTDAASEEVSYSYTTANLADVRTWARNSGSVTTDYGYNDAGQVNAIVYSGESGVTPDVSYTYDTVGRVKTAASSAMGTVTYAYDDSGMALTEEYEGGLLDELVITRTYSNAKRAALSAVLNTSSIFASQGYNYSSSTGRWDYITKGNVRADYGYTSGRNLVASVTHKWSSTPVMTRNLGYDEYGRLNSVENTVSSVSVSAHGTTSAPIVYDSEGRRTSIRREDGASWTYGYNSRHEVTSGVKKFSDGSTFVPGHQFRYDYDDIGNRKTTGTAKGGGPSGTGLDSVSYSANSLNQYSAVSTPGRIWITGESDSGSQAFVNGNWAWRKGTFLAKDISVENGSSPAYQGITVSSKLLGAGTSGATLVEEASGHQLVPQSSGSPLYDADGNLTDDDLWVYTWDAENRLIQMVSDSDVANAAKRKLVFTYDPHGRRLCKSVYTWNSSDYHSTPSSSLLFVYDGWNLIAELDTLNSNAVVRSYAWGPDMSGSLQGAGGVGGLLSVYMPEEAGAPTVLACYDVNGNISGLVKSVDGSLVASYEYGPFGEPLRCSSVLAKASPIRFSSKYEDDETGLVYYGYRYFSPMLGRFTNRDPVEENGGVNLYGFLNNRPISDVDPLGKVALTHDVVYAKSFLTNARAKSALDSAETLLKKLFNGMSFTIGKYVPVADEYHEAGFLGIGTRTYYMRNIPGSPGSDYPDETMKYLNKVFPVTNPILFVETATSLPGQGKVVGVGVIIKLQKSVALDGRLLVHELLAHFYSGKTHGDSKNWDQIGITKTGMLNPADEVLSCEAADFFDAKGWTTNRKYVVPDKYPRRK